MRPPSIQLKDSRSNIFSPRCAVLRLNFRLSYRIFIYHSIIDVSLKFPSETCKPFFFYYLCEKNAKPNMQQTFETILCVISHHRSPRHTGHIKQYTMSVNRVCRSIQYETRQPLDDSIRNQKPTADSINNS